MFGALIVILNNIWNPLNVLSLKMYVLKTKCVPFPFFLSVFFPPLSIPFLNLTGTIRGWWRVVFDNNWSLWCTLVYSRLDFIRQLLQVIPLEAVGLFAMPRTRGDNDFTAFCRWRIPLDGSISVEQNRRIIKQLILSSPIFVSSMAN